MKNFIRKASVSLLLATSLTSMAEDKAQIGFSTTEVSPGLYMLMGVNGFTGGNIGLSVGEDGVVMIDDSMPPLLDIMQKAIQTITNKPVDYLINTHVHGDHTGNNEAMGTAGAHIVAHENLRTHLLTKGVRGENGMQPAAKAALPVITFSHEMNFYLNGNDANIFHVAKAHTDGDAVIHFTKANVIHTGDTFFNGMFPFIDLSSGGSVHGYIAAQKKVLQLSNDTTKIIPGHGPLASKKDLQMSLNMLVEVEKIIAKLVKQGKTEEQVVALNPLASYDQQWSWNFITTEKMVRQVYQSLSQSKKTSHNHQTQSGGHSH